MLLGEDKFEVEGPEETRIVKASEIAPGIWNKDVEIPANEDPKDYLSFKVYKIVKSGDGKPQWEPVSFPEDPLPIGIDIRSEIETFAGPGKYKIRLIDKKGRIVGSKDIYIQGETKEEPEPNREVQEMDTSILNKITQLQTELIDKQAQIERLKSDIERKNTEIEKRDEKLSIIKQELEEYKTEVKQLRSKVEDLKEKISELKLDKIRLESQKDNESPMLAIMIELIKQLATNKDTSTVELLAKKLEVDSDLRKTQLQLAAEREEREMEYKLAQLEAAIRAQQEALEAGELEEEEEKNPLLDVLSQFIPGISGLFEKMGLVIEKKENIEKAIEEAHKAGATIGAQKAIEELKKRGVIKEKTTRKPKTKKEVKNDEGNKEDKTDSQTDKK